MVCVPIPGTGCDPECELKKATSLVYQEFAGQVLDGTIDTDEIITKYRGITLLHIAGVYCDRQDLGVCKIKQAIGDLKYSLGEEVVTRVLCEAV